MKVKSAVLAFVDSVFTNINVELEHNGVTYSGILSFENDGRDAEIGVNGDGSDFKPPLPANIVEDFWNTFWDENADYNNNFIEPILEKGYEAWEEYNDQLHEEDCCWYPDKGLVKTVS